MSEGICMCFNKAIVQIMFKGVASENGPLVLILHQIFIVNHTEWTTKNCELSSVSGLVAKLSGQ